MELAADRGGSALDGVELDLVVLEIEQPVELGGRYTRVTRDFRGSSLC